MRNDDRCKQTLWRTVMVFVAGVQSIGWEDGHLVTQLNATLTQELAVGDWQVGSDQHGLYSTTHLVRLLRSHGHNHIVA